MFDLIRPALTLLALFSSLTGTLYPLAVTGLARVFFPAQARGSLLERDGTVVGSGLVGQSFDDPAYFWGRPSATAPGPYNGAASSGSNLGPSNPALHEAVAARIASLRKVGGDPRAPVPVDLVTASASGLDPEISPAAALYQVERVARARQLPCARLQSLVHEHAEGRFLNAVGEPRVNVLELNLALDRLARGAEAH